MPENRPMKVLYVTHASNLTGASRSLLDMLAALPQGAVEPTVLLREHGPLEEKLEAMRVPHVLVPYLSTTASARATRPDWLKRVLSSAFQPGVDRFVRSGHFDLVHNNSALVDVGMLAARRAGVPYICHVRELVKEGHGMDFLDEPRVRGLMSDADAMVYISGFVAAKFRSWVPCKREVITFDAVDVKKHAGRHRRLFDTKPIRLLLAGRFHPNKGQLDAIKAVELLLGCGHDVELTLVGGIGHSSYYRKCAGYIRAHGLAGSVRILDFADDLRALRAESDIALMCSSNEALGRVTVEGMMAGCLVIGADAGATPELIGHGETGLLYEPGSPESLVEQVAWAIDNPDSANDIACKGRSWAMDSFDMASYGEAMIEFYRSVLRCGGPSL